MERDPIPEAVVAAAAEGVRAYLRGGLSEADGLVERMAASAIALFEAFAGRVLIDRGFRETVASGIRWQRLEATPVRSIDLVEGLPAEGPAFAMPMGSYAIDLDASGDGWVRVSLAGIAGRIRVTVSAGDCADWEAVPGPVAQGIVLLAAHMIEGRSEGAPPAAVSALWRPYRRMRISGAMR
ncbi:head-tail connector protein [Sphingomonas sp. AX6]|uniref:head-tail connector protein n=1 Tax=Sphingomonas sp. AX6 TaxID=2653171 RepID=UPI0012F30CCD|nr:hypothetical protein [Sphingomonas sp. AX6]VXC57680.1 conserved hypothetical protein [Sphingomonas sp. AX6]